MTLMSLLASLAAVPVVLLAKTTVLLVAALLLTLALQRASAGTRHLVWLATLGALLVLPALAAWAPWRLAILPAATPRAITSATMDRTTGAVPDAMLADGDATPTVARQALPAPSATPTASATLSARATPSIRSRIGAASPRSILLVTWAAVALLILGWLAHGAMSVRRIVRHAHPLEGNGWRGPLLEVSDRLGLEDAPRLLVSDEARMPFACGLRVPTIVLPRDCERWSLDRRHAVLLHELAHVKRLDLVSHTLGRVACALYWFHPLAWAAAKRLRAESERACDDLALSCGAKASDYAEHLLDIVASVRGDRTPVVALAMARRREFEGRMLAILDPGLRRTSPSRRQSLAVAGAVGLLAVLVGAATPVQRLDAAATTSQTPPATTPRPRQAARRAATDSTKSAIPDGARRISPPAERTSERMVERASERVDDRQVDRQVDRRMERQVNEQVNAHVDAHVSTRLDIGTAVVGAMRTGMEEGMKAGLRVNDANGTAASVLSRLQQARDDERPRLLAGILASDTSATLRRIAAWGLAQYGDDAVATTALATALRKDASADVREMAAWALASGERDREASAALATALKGDASARVRSTAAWTLASVGDEDAVPALAAALSDTSAGVRARAVWAIGSISPRSAPRELVALLKDGDPKVRKMTAWALFNLEDPSTADALDAALRVEKDRGLQLAYVRALVTMGDRAVEPLKRLLESDDPEVRAAAVRSLAGARSGGAWPMPWPMPRPFP